MLCLSSHPNHLSGKNWTLSRIIESVPSYLELQIERIKELLQTEIRPFFGSSSPGISFVSKIDEMLPWTKLCDVSFGYRFCCSVNRFKNVIQRLTSRLQLSEQLTCCGVKGQIQLCIALWLSDFSLQVLSQLLNLLRYELDTPEIFLKDVYITCWVKYDIVYIVTKAGQETRVRIFIGVMQTIGVIRGQMSL